MIKYLIQNVKHLLVLWVCDVTYTWLHVHVKLILMGITITCTSM